MYLNFRPPFAPCRWDAVELPSQFMENWCYDRRTLYSFAQHHETGQPLPEELYQRLKAAKTCAAMSCSVLYTRFAYVAFSLSVSVVGSVIAQCRRMIK